MNRKRTDISHTHIDEASRHSRILRFTEDYFSSWGYSPVHTPVFDYFETYRHLMSPSQEERSYRFPDRDGELLILRSDITLFLAKQISLLLKSAPLPLRIYYADSILRHQDQEDISSDEFFQAGAELISGAKEQADLEILMLLHDLMEQLRLPDWRIHIGSRELINILFEDPHFQDAAGKLLEMRDKESLLELLNDTNQTDPVALSELLFFLGTPTEFSRAVPGFLKKTDPKIKDAVQNITFLGTALTKIVSEDRAHIDLSEHGGQSYYTGFTVSAYVSGANTAVASGGRYDKLLEKLGHSAPAAGFSVMMRKIEPLSRLPLQNEEVPQPAEGSSFIEQYENAAKKRSQGKQVVLNHKEPDACE